MNSNIVLVAGGTGGHIWPAVSFGKWIENNKEGVNVNYICGSRPLEAEIYKSAGIVPFVLEMVGSPLSGRSWGQRLGRLRSLFSSFIRARGFLKKKQPCGCVLFAGYVSFPMIMACKSMGIPLVLHEQNAYAGKVTRIAAWLGIKIFTGWDSCQALAKSDYQAVGVPVRDFLKHSPKEAWAKLNVPADFPNSPRVVVMTGSLGSQSIKELIVKAADDEAFKGWTFVLPALSDSVVKIRDNVFLLPKIWDASLLFGVADMAVVRAGGSTLTEVGTLGIPAVIIPWRGAADDHQRYNAAEYVKNNIGIVADDNQNYDSFKDKLLELYRTNRQNEQKCTNKLYNNVSIICEDFWLALSPEFERSACCGTKQ